MTLRFDDLENGKAVHVDIDGVHLPAGSKLLLLVGAANRDPRVFAEPDRFDPDRPVGDVLSFGFGVKFCPGSHLARRELLTALDAVLERLGRRHRRADLLPAAGWLQPLLADGSPFFR